MATRFRKSKKVGPVRVNVGKKSVGVSVGGKVAGVSVNSKTGTKTRVSVPGTGVSYTNNISSGSTKASGIGVKKKTGTWMLVLGILFIISGLVAIGNSTSGGALTLVLGAVLLVLYFAKKKAAAVPEEAVDPIPVYPEVYDHSAEIEAFNAELEAIPRVDVVRAAPNCKWRNPDTMPGIHLTNITRQTNMEKFFPVVVLDTETTGIGAAKHRIVELSAIKLGPDFAPESCFTTLINPGRSIPASAEAVHHISAEMVADAPSFPEIAAGFAEYISGCRIVGHNVKFDLEFLYAAGLDLPSKAKYHDTMELAKKVLIGPGYREYNPESGTMVSPDSYDVVNYKLVTLCDYYGIYRNDAHRSLSDCLATAKVLQELVEAKTGDA